MDINFFDLLVGQSLLCNLDFCINLRIAKLHVANYINLYEILF